MAVSENIGEFCIRDFSCWYSPPYKTSASPGHPLDGARGATRHRIQMRQVSHDLAAYKEQILRKYPVNRMHQTNCDLIKANLRVRARGTVDLEQLKLLSSN